MVSCSWRCTPAGTQSEFFRPALRNSHNSGELRHRHSSEDTATPANTAVRNYKFNVSITPLSVQTVQNPPDGIVNQQYVANPLIATGGTSPITYTAPNLPPGLSINSTTGQISGAPTVVNPAGTNVTVTATDSAFPAGVRLATQSRFALAP